MLTLMNSILRTNGATAAAGLNVRTYSVIPMTTEVGLIEWVDHTAPIKSMVSDGLANDPSFKARNDALLGKTTAPGPPNISDHATFAPYHEFFTKVAKEFLLFIFLLVSLPAFLFTRVKDGRITCDATEVVLQVDVHARAIIL